MPEINELDARIFLALNDLARLLRSKRECLDALTRETQAEHNWPGNALVNDHRIKTDDEVTYIDDMIEHYKVIPSRDHLQELKNRKDL